jgi:hypothetical protein
MHIPNDPDSTARGVFGDLLRLQTEFQARLAEETVRYLRRLQGAGMPAAPGTVLRHDEANEVKATGAPGGSAALRLELENRQRVHSIVTPLLEPLVADGITWFPAVEPPPGSTLVPPGETRPVALAVQIPGDLPPGTYRGALVLQGFRDGAVPVALTVAAPAATTRTTAKASRARRPPTKRQATSRRKRPS